MRDHRPGRPSLELVVARYGEDLNWLGNIPARISAVVYDKSTDPRPCSIHLENTGREAHTYLHHICERYETLADVTVFSQGKPFDHAFDFHRTLRELAANPEHAPLFRWLGHSIDTDSREGDLFRIWSKNPDGDGLDLNGFHRTLWGSDGPDEYAFYLGGQFAVRREQVLKRPRSFYERALQISQEFPDAAHCFERCWDRVFDQGGAASQNLAGRKTAHLKPIKRERLLL
jgi:uncharacterized protein DUF3431